jgi:hypothetical protein
MAARNKRNRRRLATPSRVAAPAIDKPTNARQAAPVLAPSPSLPVPDLFVAFGVAIASAALFLTTFSANVALGDAPESVSGVKTLGVLHAPGYPSYVAAANVFARVFAVGSWAARVNAFSLVCAALMIGAVYLLARSFGASRAGSALGGLMLASSAAFWFNADFAKHYAFSGLLITLAALAVTLWESGRRSGWLIFAGVLLGLCAGASWELALITTAGLGVLVVFGGRRAGAALIVGSIAALLLVTVGAYAFLMVRAASHPAVNWGEVTDLHRLVAQVTQQDFRSDSVASSQHGVALKIAIRVPSYLAIITRDIGLGGAALALFGAVFGLRLLDRGRRLFLAVVAALNLGAVVFVAGVDHISGFLTGLVAGGYLLDLLVVVAVLAALGTAPLAERVGELAARRATPRRYRSSGADDPDRFHTTIIGALFVMVLVPSILVHYHLADHRQPPIADRYANRVLGELPAHAALFVYQADLTFPLVYRQAVLGDRPDVSVIITTSLQFAWYRQQIDRTLHLRAPLAAGPTTRQVQTLIDELRSSRPVYIDTGMIYFFRSFFPYRLRGLVGEIVDHASDTTIDPNALATELIRDDQADAIAGHAYVQFPNGFVHFLYARAHIELAKDFAGAHQLTQARTELARALDDYPDDPTTKLVLRYSGQPGENLAQVVRVIQAL